MLVKNGIQSIDRIDLATIYRCYWLKRSQLEFKIILHFGERVFANSLWLSILSFWSVNKKSIHQVSHYLLLRFPAIGSNGGILVDLSSWWIDQSFCLISNIPGQISVSSWKIPWSWLFSGWKYSLRGQRILLDWDKGLPCGLLYGILFNFSGLIIWYWTLYILGQILRILIWWSSS